MVDLLREDFCFSSEQVSKIAELGEVEFDQLICILPPESPDVDLSAEIYNVDGSVAKNCINGARCLAKFVVDEELIAKEFSSPLLEVFGTQRHIATENIQLNS